MDELKDRVAIVTGAGRGLGRAHAIALAERGAKVIVNDIGVGIDGSGGDASLAEIAAAEIRQAGGEAIGVTHDVSDWQQSEQLIDSAVDAFGGLDVLVNNAGILRDRTISNMSEQEWDDVVRVVLKGHAGPSHHALAYWRKCSKQGDDVRASVIHTSSLSGLVGNFGQGNYGAAKLGLVALSRIIALEGERIGVRSNAIAPGASTRMGSGEPDPGGEFAPAKVSPLVVWLAQRDCPANAQIVFISGPRLVVLSMPPVCEVLEEPGGWTVETIQERLPAALVSQPPIEDYIGDPVGPLTLT